LRKNDVISGAFSPPPGRTVRGTTMRFTELKTEAVFEPYIIKNTDDVQMP
jgi:hypothetical protein